MRVRSPVACLLALVLASAGCTQLAPGGDDTRPLPQDCPQAFQVIRWQEPELFAALPTQGTFNGFEMSYHEPAPGIPLGAIEDPERWANASIQKAIWKAPSLDPASHGREQLWLTPAQQVIGVLEDRHDEEAMRALFAAFASNVTSADTTAVSSWADAFQASRQEAGTGMDRDGGNFTLYSYEADVDGPYRLAALVHELLEAGAIEAAPGASDYQGEVWVFQLELAHVRAEREDADEAAWQLDSDAWGRTIFARNGARLAANQTVASELGDSLQAMGVADLAPATAEVETFCPE